MTKLSTPAPRPDAADRPAWRRYLPLALLACAMAGAYAAGLHRYLSLDAVAKHRDWLKGAVEAHRVTAVFAYAGLYAAGVALSLPGAALLSLLGGFLFGWLLGGFVAVLAATLGAIAVFLAARSALGEALQRRAGPRLGRIIAGFRDEAAAYLLFLRLVPAFPFWLVNLAAAVGGVRLRVFAWTTLIGIVPGTFAIAVAGSSLDSVVAAQAWARAACLAAGGQHCGEKLHLKAIVTPELLAAFALMGCTALIPVIWRRISKRRRHAKGGEA